jgi:hypothetical protein
MVEAKEQRYHLAGGYDMCRNIRTLFNFEPPATDEEIRAASLQFVRKLSGFNAPSKANEAAFNRGIEETFQVARRLIDSLITSTPPRDRAVEAARAKARAALRFGTTDKSA